MNPLFSLTSAMTRFVVARGASCLLLLYAASIAATSNAVHAQSAIDGFDPNANGAIYAILVQPDGKIVIAGDFTMLAPNGGTPIARNRIARLNPDGSIDIAFSASADNLVTTLALQPDGKILIGGNFTIVSGQARRYIARLDGATGTVDAFAPEADHFVRTLLLQPDGKLLVGGIFSNIGGQPRRGIARLDTFTGLADSFNANAQGPVFALAIDRGGKLLVGGDFTSIGGQLRNRIARLDLATGAADPFNPNADGEVQMITQQADGRIVIGGTFHNVGGQVRNYLARLDPATGLADSFNPNPNSIVSALSVQPDGKILVAGSFGGPNSIGGQARNSMARLDPATGLADAFDPKPNGAIVAIAVQPGGKVLIGGSFNGWNSVGSQARNHIARLEADGRVDQTLDPRIVGYTVYAAAMQRDGKIVIGGEFTSVFGQPRRNIARLNTDGTLDPTFNPGADATVIALAVQGDGKILAAGTFSMIGGETRRRIARLDPITGLPDSFNPNASGIVSVIAIAPDGKILVAGGFNGANSIGGASRNYIARLDPQTGLADAFDPEFNGPPYTLAVDRNGRILAGGQFTNVGGQERNYIARLDPVTGQPDGFAPNADAAVYSIAEQSDGRILAAGTFTAIGRQSRNRIGRLDPSTGLADSFDPNSSGAVFTMALQADGKIVVSGFFAGSIGGQTRDRIARLDPTTGLADSWNPGANNAVHAMLVQPDGKIVVGGSFAIIGGQPRTNFARLTNDTASSEELAVSPTTINWARGGSAPEPARVTFEYSSDGLNYSSLGTTSFGKGNWTLSGLAFPTEQNFYVRARGYYTSGVSNGSHSVTESVRMVHLTTPLALASAVSRKTHGSAGVYDVSLPLTGEPGVECRSSGGDHTLVFTFSDIIGSGNAELSSGIGAISGSATINGNTMTVNVAGVADAQKITVMLSGVTDSVGHELPDTAVSMNILAGDINSSKVVNSSDIGALKAQSGVPVTQANFRADVALSGGITASDIGLVKSRSGQSVP